MKFPLKFEAPAMPFYSLHGDFWNTWHTASKTYSEYNGTLTGLTENCLSLHQICSFVKDPTYPGPP